MAQAGQTHGVSADEDQKIAETAAIFANKLYVTMTPMGAKITFAEMLRSGQRDIVVPRSAVFLQLQDVVALRELLNSLDITEVRQ